MDKFFKPLQTSGAILLIVISVWVGSYYVLRQRVVRIFGAGLHGIVVVSEKYYSISKIYKPLIALDQQITGVYLIFYQDT